MAEVKTTFNFDQMLSSAREAYGEELMRMADEGLNFVFTYTDNVAPSSAAGKFVQKYPERCFNYGIAEPNQVGASAGLALSGLVVYSSVPSCRCVQPIRSTRISPTMTSTSASSAPMQASRPAAAPPTIALRTWRSTERFPI